MTEPEQTTPVTTYQILTSTDDGKTWDHIGAQEARTQDTALNAFFPNGFVEDTLYVAVAGHYWNPQALQVRKVLMGLAPISDDPSAPGSPPADQTTLLPEPEEVPA